MLLPCLYADTPFAELLNQLQEPIKIHLKSGKHHEGFASAFTESSLEISTDMDGSQITYKIHRSEVQEMKLPDANIKRAIGKLIEAKNYRDAQVLYDALLSYTKSYFPFVSGDDVNFFYRYLTLLIDFKNYNEALVVAKILERWSDSEAIIKYAKDMILLSHYKSGDSTTTTREADAWIKEFLNDRRSAVGWRIRAELYYQAGDFENALWTSLSPITFSSQVPMPYLEHCYAIAIASCMELKNAEKAEQLMNEMQERGLEWTEEMSHFKKPNTKPNIQL
jgi:pentatricopeptide repeat protein